MPAFFQGDCPDAPGGGRAAAAAQSAPQVDYHIHATAYRAVNPQPEHTAAAVLARCQELGLEMAGVIEHLNRGLAHPAACIQALVAEFRGLSPQIPFYVGAEADIIDAQGRVTCSAEQKRGLGLHYLLGAVHVTPDKIAAVADYVQYEFQLALGMLRNCPQVDVLAHPWGQGVRWERNGSVARWSFDLVPQALQDQLIETAVSSGKALEANPRGDCGADAAYALFLAKARAAGVRVAVGSDAHRTADIGRALRIGALLKEIGFTAADLWHPRI